MTIFLPPDVSEAILGDLVEEARLRRSGRIWIYWQLARSVWPLVARAAEREGITNVALWFFAGYFVFGVPLFGIGSIRDFVLTQVPLRTGAEPGPLWIGFAVVANAAGLVFGCWLALRRMGRHL
jgi:hypothetical protein